MEIYLDNSATTKMKEEVAERMLTILTQDYGNPSSLHTKGIEAEKHLRNATQTLAGLLKADEREIFYTSGGTESDNWAVFSAAETKRRMGKRILTTAIEHPAVIQPLKKLEKQGFEIILLPVDEKGVVSLTALEEALNEETILVSVMQINNEVGSIQPIETIGAMIREKAPDALFHVDGVQGFTKQILYPKKAGVDLYSVSAHKVHGPKGVGLLYVSKQAKLTPYIYGGGQQAGMRSGTENVAGIAGLAMAAESAFDGFDETIQGMYALKDGFIRKLLKLPDVRLNGPWPYLQDPESKESPLQPDPEKRIDAPHIVNASFLGVRSEVLLHTLEDRGIFVSAGSACSSHKQTKSATLGAMGIDEAGISSALRFSFSEFTTKQELDETIEVLEEVLPTLRRFTRR